MIMGSRHRNSITTSSSMIYMTVLKILLSFLASANTDITSPSGVLLPYQTLYVNGVEAYMKQRWTECVTLVSRAISDHKSFKNTLNTCRQYCRNAGHLKVDETNFLESVYLDSALVQSSCIQNCTDRAYPNRRPYKDFSSKLKEVELHFQNSDPYDYLQMCAFKAEEFELAFSAAFTFAIARPNHPYASLNLNYYQKIAGDKKQELFKNLEYKVYQELRYAAVDAYDAMEWKLATDKFEASLAAYFKADVECELECDSLFDEQKFSEFHKKVTEAKFKEEVKYYLANHWLKLLGCRELCTKKLSTVNGVQIDRFFLDHFHYLQYCYYKAGNPKKAASNVATYLLFSSQDPNQMYNKIFYLQQGHASEEDFAPRQDAQEFYDRKYLDLRLKKMAEEEFMLHRGKRNLKPYTFKSHEVYNPPTNESIASFLSFLHSVGMTLSRDSSIHGGHMRVVADGVASPQECQRLIDLANICQGEKINKVTVSKAAEMVRDGKASSDQVSTLMQVSDKARDFLEKYHNLKVPLLFQRTQLTYRENESENLKSGNTTLKDLDACSTDHNAFCTGVNSRDFVAYIHLDDREGANDIGTFYFANEGDQPSVGIEPRQGRLVGMTIEDKHYLNRVINGSRYSLIIWFTLSPTDQELDHAEARTVLRIVAGGATRTSKISLASLDFMKSKHYSLSFDEEDLNGPERFAVDGLASDEECRSLIRLTNSFGSMGSGYDSGFSHTKHESFTGVTVETATELAQQHKVSPEDVQLYLRLSNDMRELTRKVFLEDRPLYFSFTHLVCRTALNDENLDRTDLSHPIHSDNCIIQEDNTCKKVRPAYTERDYSAILYLNDDFFGGDFFFAHQNMSVQSRIKPKCGRSVSFNSGHYHGVKPVLSGQRCAVAIWFTLDQDYDETSHPIAKQILNQLEKDVKKGGVVGEASGHFHMDL